ncbi:MarR family winged helix-turn-helix transcriptional regulator [Erythrobacter sp. Alg231-14]|uniref:MarR family winged helix-turn-helix transcriptional regulator n=1 Tax=Erythrobacter sp. Alg231-14 TaxID=1922225 RepID=UPI00307BEC00
MSETKKTPPKGGLDDPVAYRLFNEIGIIHQFSQAAFREVLPKPLNTAMFGVLNHFVRMGDGKTPSHLATLFQVARPSMTATLAKLERAGFVQIKPGEGDGRTKRVWITSDGRAARTLAVEASQGLMERIDPLLSQLDLDRLVGELGQIRETLDRDRDSH